MVVRLTSVTKHGQSLVDENRRASLGTGANAPAKEPKWRQVAIMTGTLAYDLVTN